MAIDTALLPPKREFLIVDDYGMGGVWAVVKARSPEGITSSFPEVRVFGTKPEWMSDEQFAIAARQSFDLEDDDPPQWLADTNQPRTL